MIPVTRRARRELTRVRAQPPEGWRRRRFVVAFVWVNSITCGMRADWRGASPSRAACVAREKRSMRVFFCGLDAPGARGRAIRCARWVLAVRASFTTPASTLARPPARTCAVDYTRAPDTVRDTRSIEGTVR